MIKKLVICSKSELKTRLRPIPEFTDTTDTLDLYQFRYWVPIPIPVVKSQPPGRVVSLHYAWTLNRPALCMYTQWAIKNMPLNLCPFVN